MSVDRIEKLTACLNEAVYEFCKPCKEANDRVDCPNEQGKCFVQRWIAVLNEAGGNEILQDILTELQLCKLKHPEFPADLVGMTSIMAEEAGEAVREANSIHFERKGNFEQYKRELRQTAAVCIRILETLQKKKSGNNG